MSTYFYLLAFRVKQRYLTDGVEDARFEAKAKNSRFEDRPSPGQGQEYSRPRPSTKDTGASVLQKKFFFQVLKKFWLALELRSRGFYVQAYADYLAVLVTGADML